MALATQCPHCQTIFRVAHDQLKLRAGLVRCGACKEIFNGIENLLRSEDVPAVVPSPAAPDATSTAPTSRTIPSEEERWSDLPSTPAIATTAKSAESNPEDYFPAVFFDTPPVPSTNQITDPSVHTGSAAVPLFSQVLDPLDRMTLIHVSDDIDHLDPDHVMPAATDVTEGDLVENEAVVPLPISAGSSGSLMQRSAHETADELDQAIDYLQRKPWRGSKKTVSRKDIEGPRAPDNMDGDQYHADEPEFLARSRSAQQRRGTLRKLQIAAATLLTIAVVLQSLYLLHDQLAARLPASRPALEALCNVLGCRVGLPAQIDAVSIESNELIAVPSSKNNFSLNLLLRNRSSVPQRWPAIELTLLDGNDRPLVRRVFSPVEYLPTTMAVPAGFTQNSEQSTRIQFESAQQKAANYRVVLFYP
jgi:predicted Zn finger-like uncharacterized protein